MKHTPGPWHYIVDPEGKFGIYPEEGKFLAITDHEANANLIAQAPAMLEVLQNLEKVGMSIRAESVIWADIRAVLARVVAVAE